MTPLFSGPVVFVEEGHEYYVEVDGGTFKKPSLSHLLKKQGLTPEYDKEIPPHVLRTAAERGQEVHTAIANEIVGAPVEIKKENEYLFDAAKKLYRENRMEATFVEVPFFNPVFDYACTPDFVGTAKGRPVIIDWKTTVTIHREAGAQLAGQALCFRHPEEFDLYIGDLRRGVLVKFDSEPYLRVARQAFQLFNDWQDLISDPG